MNHRTIVRRLFPVALGLVLCIETDGAARDPTLRTVEDWVARATEVDATIARYEAEARALEHRADASSSNPYQPQLGYTGSPLPVETRQGPILHQLSVSQTVPWGGVLHDRAVPLEASTETWEHRSDGRRLDLREQIIDGLLVLWTVEEELAVVSEQSVIYEDVTVHVSDAMVHGGAEYSDLLRMTLGRELLETRTTALARRRRETLAALEPLLQMELDDVARPDDIDDYVDVSTERLSEGGVPENALQRHPAVELAETVAVVHELSADVASQALRPLPTFTVAWSVISRYDTPLPNTGDGGADALLVGVRLPLPVFRRQVTAEERAFEAQASAARIEGEEAIRRLDGEIGVELARLEEATDELLRYQHTLLPLADDVVEALSSELLTGQTEHTAFLLAFDQRLEMQIAVVELRAEAARAWWRIDALTAGGLAAQHGLRDSGESVMEEAP